MRVRIKVGTKQYQRYPRTGDYKRPRRWLHSMVGLEAWLTAPLHISAGRFGRLRREMINKPARAEHALRHKAEGDDALAKLLFGKGQDDNA